MSNTIREHQYFIVKRFAHVLFVRVTGVGALPFVVGEGVLIWQKKCRWREPPHQRLSVA